MRSTILHNWWLDCQHLTALHNFMFFSLGQEDTRVVQHINQRPQWWHTCQTKLFATIMNFLLKIRDWKILYLNSMSYSWFRHREHPLLTSTATTCTFKNKNLAYPGWLSSHESRLSAMGASSPLSTKPVSVSTTGTCLLPSGVSSSS